MTKKQLFALCLSNFAIFVVGAGALPLLPVYAAQLGAPPVVTGYYLAFCYIALAAGTYSAGWLSDRFGRRRWWLALAGLLGIPVTAALGHVAAMWTLITLTALLWFLGGLGLSSVNILVGLFAGDEKRGQAFGFLALAMGTGTLTGGIITGPLVDAWGYTTMFALLSLFWVPVLVAVLFVQDKPLTASHSGQTPATEPKTRLSKDFYLLFVAHLIGAAAGFMSLLGRSLRMDFSGFTATAISSTGAIAALVTLPVPLWVGALSDRLGRKQFLIVCYLTSAAGLAALSLSTSLWHFWIAVSLGQLSGTIGAPVGQAMATDRLAPESLGRGLSLYNTGGSIGATIGFICTGYAVEALGTTFTLIGGALLPLIAIILLIPVQRASHMAKQSMDPAHMIQPVGKAPTAAMSRKARRR